ncbi:MAG: hypothetical protein JWM41_3277 [Gemmatimonadetes bacterium]|nr:hypothetical protein [Gemmatimonadota bacterium]
MRSRLLVLSSIVALGLAAAPATASAQRMLPRDCVRYGYGCSRYDDAEARIERQRARAVERADRAEARAQVRAETRAEARAYSARCFGRADFSRVDRSFRLRERLDANRALRMRALRHHW